MTRFPALALAGISAGAVSCAKAATPSPVSAPGLAIPFGRAPVVDGQVSDAEWSGALAVALGGGATLRILHDGARVYLGIAGVPAAPGAGFGCVMIAEPGQVRVLHASYKLGSAVYTPNGRGTYRPRSKTYDWRDAEALLRDEGWMASTARADGGREQEFALGFARLGLPHRPARIALGYFYQREPGATDLSTASALVWPAGLDDAVAEVELLAGLNPDGLRFETERWVTLRPEPPRR